MKDTTKSRYGYGSQPIGIHHSTRADAALRKRQKRNKARDQRAKMKRHNRRAGR